MADGKVNLTFSTVAQLQGINQLSDSLKKTGRDVKDFGDAGAQIVGNLSAQFKGPMMDALGSVFGALQGLARGGLWGIIGQQVGSIVGKFAEWHKTISTIREEDRRMRANAARNAEGYARRVASYAEKAAQKEKEAYEARAKAHAKMVAEIVKNNGALAAADAKMRDARRRQEVASGAKDELLAENEGRSDAARAAVEAARQAEWAVNSRFEAGMATEAELRIAKKNHAAAEAELAAVEAENAKRLRDRKTEEEIEANEELSKQEDEFRKQLKAEEEQRKKEAAAAERKRIEAIKDSADAMKQEVSVLDQAIAAQKKLADEWEQNAQKMRGKNFATWQREQNAADAAQNAEQRRFGRANAEAGRRASRIRRDARHGWASARDRAWLAQYDEWSAAQSAGNNPYTSEAEKLEAERAEKVASIDDKLGEVKQLLKDAITME